MLMQDIVLHLTGLRTMVASIVVTSLKRSTTSLRVIGVTEVVSPYTVCAVMVTSLSSAVMVVAKTTENRLIEELDEMLAHSKRSFGLLI